jgi:peptide/nickel transport system ATP-binding protein
METRFLLKGVSKFYMQKNRQGIPRQIPALDKVNLTIYDKKINALVGESGCGKSTLSRVLMRLESHDSGEIIYQGKNIESTPKKEFRKKNQIMFQNPLLSVNPYFKVYKILAEPLIINKTGKKEIEEKIGHLLEIFTLPFSYLKKYPSELSGGELQRIVLARALVLEPEFLILDEPFSALDEIMAARLVRCFKKIFTRLNIGVLYISHHPGHVKFLADYINTMEKGKIINPYNENPAARGAYMLRKSLV